MRAWRCPKAVGRAAITPAPESLRPHCNHSATTAQTQCRPQERLQQRLRDGSAPRSGMRIRTPKQLLIFNDLGKTNGGPRRIRTPDPLIRSQVLYPAELSVRVGEAVFRLSTNTAQPLKQIKLHHRHVASRFQRLSPLARSVSAPHCRHVRGSIPQQWPIPNPCRPCERRPGTA